MIEREARAACVVARYGNCRASGNGCQTMMSARGITFPGQLTKLLCYGRQSNSNKIPAIALTRGPTVREFRLFRGVPMRRIAARHWLADRGFALSLTLSEC